MAIQLPALNKPIRVTPLRGRAAPFNQNTNYKLAVSNRGSGQLAFLDRQSLTVDRNLQTRGAAHAMAFDHAVNAFWTWNNSNRRLKRRPWSEINQFVPQTNREDIVPTPTGFPARVTDLAATNNHLMVADGTPAIKIYRYEPVSHDIFDTGETITIGTDPSTEVDIATRHLWHRTGIYEIRFTAAGLPIIGDRVASSYGVGLGALGTGEDFIVFVENNVSEEGGDRYEEDAIGSGSTLDTGIVEVLGFEMQDAIVLSHRPTVLNPADVTEAGELLGEAVMTPRSFSLDTESIGQESTVAGVTTFQTVPIYDTPGSARVTFELNKYEPAMLLIGGWTFQLHGVQYRLESIDSDDTAVFGVFSATII